MVKRLQREWQSAVRLLLQLFFYILTVIAGWKILEKAGEKGWKALITVAYIIFILIAQIKYVINAAKAFGKGTIFMIALFFSPNICWLILGFGKAKYNKKAVNA